MLRTAYKAFTKAEKKIVVAIAILGALTLIPIVFIKLAFGPLHSSVVIELPAEGELICEETYNGDISDTFYDVEMMLETSDGKEYNLGSVTFHEQDWRKQLKAVRAGDWFVILFEPDGFVEIKMVNTINGQLTDTTLTASDLWKDSLYKEKFKDSAHPLDPGTSTLTETADDQIEVNYAYKAKAAYPSEIPVTQKVIYAINRLEGKLRTKAIGDRVVQ